MKQRDLILSVRDLVDQVTHGRAVTMLDVDQYAYSRVSDTQIADAIESAARYIASRVGADKLGDLVVRFDPYGPIPSSSIRLVDDLTRVDGVKARRVGYRAFAHLHPLRRPTALYPGYSYEDRDLTVHPNGLPAESAVIVCPITEEFVLPSTTFAGSAVVSIAGVDPLADGGFITIPGADLLSDGVTPTDFVGHIVSMTGASVTVDRVVPLTVAANATYTIPGVHRMPGYLSSSIAYRAAELVATMLIRPDLAGSIQATAQAALQNIGIAFA